MSQSEAQIQHDILLAFGAHPRLRLWRSNSGAARNSAGRLVTYNFKGCPDLSGFIGPEGRAFFVEVKSATGRQSLEQRQFQAICQRFGAVYCLARSVEDVRRALVAAGVDA
jgi:hypothetical protein